MRSVRKTIGGLGNLMFKQAFLYSQMREGVIQDLYVQSPKYWIKYAEEIRHLFSEGITGNDERISLHIRRGDYVGNDFYVDLCTTDYYQKAVKLFEGKRFLVFCADRQGQDDFDRMWSKGFMDGLNVPYDFHEPQEEETDDLNAMANCKGHIMANSSFSWWAAFLGSGMTVAPKQWFTDGIQRIDLLDDWKKI